MSKSTNFGNFVHGVVLDKLTILQLNHAFDSE